MASNSKLISSVIDFLSDPATGNLSHTRIGSILAQVLGVVAVGYGYYTHVATLPEVIAFVGVVTGNATLSKAVSLWKASKDEHLDAAKKHSAKDAELAAKRNYTGPNVPPETGQTSGQVVTSASPSSQSSKASGTGSTSGQTSAPTAPVPPSSSVKSEGATK